MKSVTGCQEQAKTNEFTVNNIRKESMFDELHKFYKLGLMKINYS